MVIIRRATEAPFEHKLVRDAARDLGLRSLKLTLRHDAGWPDRLWLIPGGRPLFMELKAPGKEPSPLQRARLETLEALGYDACWFNDYDSAMEILGSTR